MANKEARKAAMAKASRIVQSDDPFTNHQGGNPGQRSYPQVLSRTIRAVLDEDADTSHRDEEIDADRINTLHSGWEYVGIYAEAEVQLTGSLVQTFSSGGLWGVESDAGAPYLCQIAEDQLDILEDELKAVGAYPPYPETDTSRLTDIS